MSLRTRLGRLGAGCIALTAFFHVAGAEMLAGDDIQAEAKESSGKARVKVLSADAGRGPYWIGVVLHDIDKNQRKKLKLKESQGLAIHEVVAGSPAAKAGLAQGDIIVSVNDALLDDMAQLPFAVAASKGRAIKLGVLREGKTRIIALKPGKLPAGESRVLIFGEQRESDVVKRGLQWLQRQRTPGAVARLAPARLPDDMRVTIEKRGGQPARVTVKQGQKMWRTTEGQLDMLPSEARAYVTGLLRRPGVKLGEAPQKMELKWGMDAKSQPSVKAASPSRVRIEIEESREIKPSGKRLELKRAKPRDEAQSEQLFKELQEIIEQLEHQRRQRDKSPGGGK